MARAKGILFPDVFESFVWRGDLLSNMKNGRVVNIVFNFSSLISPYRVAYEKEMGK